MESVNREEGAIIPTLGRDHLAYPEGHPAGPHAGVTSAALPS